MPVNFGLANEAAKLPMSADPVGQASRLYTLAGQERQDSAEVLQKQRDEADHAVMTEAMKDPGFDLHTPDGLKRTLGTLRGKISPENYMKLEDHSTRVATADAQLRHAISQMDAEQRKTAIEATDQVMPLLDTALKGYETAREAKGEQAARSELAPMAAQLAAMGKNINPVLIKALQDGDINTLKGLYAGSAHQKSLLTAAELQARADKERALTEALKSGDGGKTPPALVSDPDHPEVKYSIAANKKSALRFTPQNPDGERISIDQLPAKLAPAVTVKNVQAAGSANASEDILTPEQHAFMAEYEFVTHKQIPGLPVGRGPAADRARQLHVQAFVKLAEQYGLSAQEMAEKNLAGAAAITAMGPLTKQAAVMEGAEKNAIGVLAKIKKEVDALGGPDSPKLRRLWNSAASDWAGDPAFTGLNLLYTDLQEGLAKVYSGATGAAATPVGFLHKAEATVPKDPSLGQIVSMSETLPELFKIRVAGTQGILKELRKAGALGSKGGDDPSKDVKVTPDEQATKDTAAGVQDAVNKYRGDVKAAKADLAKYDAALKDAKGDTKSLLQTDRDRVAAAVAHMEKKTDASGGGWREIAPGVRVRVKPGAP